MAERRHTRAQIIRFQRLKAASGGTGFSGGGGYRAGQSLICKISHAEPGGFGVLILKANDPGFLPTGQNLIPGDEIVAKYVCISNGRILLQPLFKSQPACTDKVAAVDWEEQLN